jgi:hypothetical protein
MGIHFTQFLRPDGRRKTVTIERPPEVEANAKRIADAGLRFECEVLTTNEVSLTIADDDEDLAFEVVPNGPDVPNAVDRLLAKGLALEGVA